MICPKCKKNIEEMSKYCNHCGINISNYKRKQTNIGVSTLESLENYIELTKPRTNFQQIYLKSNNTKQKTQISNQIQSNLNPNSHQAQYNYSTSYSGVKPQINTHQTQYNYSNTYSGVQQQKANDHQDQYNYSNNYSKTTTKYISSDEDYIKAFVGEKYDSINKSKFSIPTLLFGGFYLIYRKLWIYAIIWFIIIIMTGLSIPIIVFVNIFLAVNFTKIYLYYAKLMVSDIKTRNHDKTNSEIIEICSKKGGVTPLTNKFTIGIFVILPMILITFISMSFEDSEDILKEKEMNNENLEYIIPTGYEKTYSDEYSESYTSNNECKIKIDIDPYNTDSINKYMSEKQINSNNKIIPKRIDINTWYYSMDITTHYYYEYLGIDKDEKKYLVTFSYPTENKFTCKDDIQSFINTLRFKNDTIYNSEKNNYYDYN